MEDILNMINKYSFTSGR